MGLIEQLRFELAQHGDPSRAVGQQSYMKSAMPYYGLTQAEQRAVTRRVIAEAGDELDAAHEWERAIRRLWDEATHREEWYAAITIARHPRYAAWRTSAAMSMYQHLIVNGAWWDVVDEVATHLVGDTVMAFPDREGRRMQTWSLDGDMWIRRSAILSQIHAGRRTDTNLLSAVIVPNLERTASADGHGRQDFFIRKAIGWALRDYSYTDPEWVRAFVAFHSHEMAGLTIREATKRLA